MSVNQVMHKTFFCLHLFCVAAVLFSCCFRVLKMSNPPPSTPSNHADDHLDIQSALLLPFNLPLTRGSQPVVGTRTTSGTRRSSIRWYASNVHFFI